MKTSRYDFEFFSRIFELPEFCLHEQTQTRQANKSTKFHVLGLVRDSPQLEIF